MMFFFSEPSAIKLLISISLLVGNIRPFVPRTHLRLDHFDKEKQVKHGFSK